MSIDPIAQVFRCDFAEPRLYCNEYASWAAHPSGKVMTRCSNCYQVLYESDSSGPIWENGQTDGITAYYCPSCEMLTGEGNSVFESPAEVLFWHAWSDARGPYYPYTLKPQYWVVAGGYRFRLDFAIPENRLNIEIDGQQHTSPEHAARDRWRDDLLERDGWQIVRFTGKQVWRDAGQCAQKAVKLAGYEDAS